MNQIYVLDNGLTVICDKIDFFKTFSMGFWISVGSKYEDQSTNGYTHLLEHMLFKGTHKRSYFDISHEIEGAGGYINAFTEREHTCFYVNMMKHHLEIGSDVLWDMISNSTLDKIELDKEKSVVIEEIKMYEDNPDELIYDLFYQHIWKDHPLGYPILGTETNIENVTKDKLLDFYKFHYKPENIIISVSGNINEQNLLSYLKKQSINCTNQNSLYHETPVKYQLTTGNQIKQLEQVYFVYGYQTIGYDDDSRYTLYILNNILGNGSSSRLFHEVREKQGLCYSIYSFHYLQKNNGILGISSSCSINNFKKVIDTVANVIQNLLDHGVTQEEVDRAKEQIKGNLTFSQENLESRMIKNARNYLNYNKIIPYDEVISKINMISLQNINELIYDLFHNKNKSFYSLGPKKHLNMITN